MAAQIRFADWRLLLAVIFVLSGCETLRLGKPLVIAPADNTMDGGKDYAKVYVNTPEGLRMFKASVPEQRWGRPGFTYTERVAY